MDKITGDKMDKLDLIAAKSERNDKTKWLSFKIHALDTAGIMEMLFNKWLSNAVRNYIIESLDISADRDHSYIPAQSELKIGSDAKYFYYCANNTIYGTEWHYVPDTQDIPLVCDMSSDILSKPVNVSDFGLIYAGAQKNMAPAGLTVVIIDKSLAGKELAVCPSVMSYDTLIKKDSMLNTPPCWCIYMLGLMLDWLESMGGVAGMESIKSERAAKLYDFLDNSKLFIPHAERDSRSDMNVTFRTGNDALDADFVKGASKHGLLNIKGHRLTGGMRASLYNAMPMEGIDALVGYMKQFEVEHNV